ncbi:hypothetical protein NFI96_003805 [Prochilodus magdalenae]|nr:hypothetical protein NFI96_003805 [Prochilodus magdalenae]
MTLRNRWSGFCPLVEILMGEIQVALLQPPGRELNGNNFTRINKNDFAGLKYLRVLGIPKGNSSPRSAGLGC